MSHFKEVAEPKDPADEELFKIELMRQIENVYIPKWLRDVPEVKEKAWNMVMARIKEGMLSPAELEFVKLDTELGELKRSRIYHSTIKYEKLGGDARLTELENEFNRRHSLGIDGVEGGHENSDILMSRLDELLIQVFDEDVECDTDCRSIIMRYSPLFAHLF